MTTVVTIYPIICLPINFVNTQTLLLPGHVIDSLLIVYGIILDVVYAGIHPVPFTLNIHSPMDGFFKRRYIQFGISHSVLIASTDAYSGLCFELQGVVVETPHLIYIYIYIYITGCTHLRSISCHRDMRE